METGQLEKVVKRGARAVVSNTRSFLQSVRVCACFQVNMCSIFSLDGIIEQNCSLASIFLVYSDETVAGRSVWEDGLRYSEAVSKGSVNFIGFAPLAPVEPGQ